MVTLVDKVVKMMFGMLDFNRLGTEYNGWDSILGRHDVGETTNGVLCARRRFKIYLGRREGGNE